MSVLDQIFALRGYSEEDVIRIPHYFTDAFLEQARDELAALRARLAEAERLLEESEWGARDPDRSTWTDDGYYCWSCDRTRDDKMLHEPDCALAAFLRGHKSGKETNDAV